MFKKCYFDTSVYNRLIDTDIARIVGIIKQNNINIFFSDFIAREFMLTGCDNKIRELWNTAKKICNNRILNHPPTIIMNDIKAFYNKQNIPSHMDSDFKIFNNALVERYLNNSEQDRVKMESDAKKDKKRFKSMMKFHKESIGKILEEHNVSLPGNYNDFFRELYEAGKLICVIHNNLFGQLKIDFDKEFSKKMIDYLASVKYYTKFFLCLVYQYCKNQKPGFGDNYDWQHVVYLSDCDIFVTEDKAFLDYVKLITNNEKEIYDKDDFLRKYSLLK